MAEVARALEQLRSGRQVRIDGRLERIRCVRCSRLLPERDGVCPACIHKWSTLKRISAYLSPYRWKAVVLALSSLVTTGAELAPPLITKHLVDRVLVPQSPADTSTRLELLGFFVAMLVGVRLVSWGAEWVHSWVVVWLGARATADIRHELYHRLEVLSLQFYDKRKVGALMSRVTRDTGRLQDFLVEGLPYLVINALLICGILGFLLWMSWELTLYTLAPVPLILVWGVVFWKRMRRLFTRWGETWSNLTDRTAEALTGIRVVKAFAQESREIGAFHRLNRRITDIGVQTSVNRTVFFATVSFLTNLGVLVVWFVGGNDVIDGDLTLGTLVAFYSFLWMVYGPLEWFGQVNSWMTRAFAGAERVFEVIDTAPESYDDERATRLPRMQGEIAFRDVTFGYDKSKPVLKGIDLHARAGEMIGIVGRSGVGKTTLVNLVARFYDADHGAIEIDGIDVRHLNLRDLRIFRDHRREHRLRQSRRPDRADHGGGAAGERAQLPPRQAGWLRVAGGRAGQPPVGRRAAACRHRPGDAARSADPRPRRGDERRRRGDGEADPAGDGAHGRGAHDLRHRPPAVDAARRRASRGARRGAHRRGGHARRADAAPGGVPLAGGDAAGILEDHRHRRVGARERTT
jgi:ATP-binding cassette subfamily B protein